MKTFIIALLGSLFLSTSIMAQSIAPELPREPKWMHILQCKSIKTGRLVIEEKFNSRPSVSSDVYTYTYEPETGNKILIFPMGADTICYMMGKSVH